MDLNESGRAHVQLSSVFDSRAGVVSGNSEPGSVGAVLVAAGPAGEPDQRQPVDRRSFRVQPSCESGRTSATTSPSDDSRRLRRSSE